DDGSCIYDIPGCMDILAINYNPLATVDDGSCLYCGNNKIDSGEKCDGTDLGGKTCADFGLAPGTLACLPDCSGFDPSGCGPVLPPTAGDRLYNCQYPGGANMNSLAGFDPLTNMVYLTGVWSVNKVDSSDGFRWYTTCQPGWYGLGATSGWKDLGLFASTHSDGDYIAYSGQLGRYLFFRVENNQLVVTQDLCTACPDNSLGLCDPAICLSLGATCRNIVVKTMGGSFGMMCVAENQCNLCGMVIGDICNAKECTAIGPACSYKSSTGACN
ncbi:hypothetical protein AMJ47_01865, partial [Parcubacteria bacterium DG_72]